MAQFKSRTDQDRKLSAAVVNHAIEYINNTYVPKCKATMSLTNGKIPKARQEYIDKHISWLTHDAPAIDVIIDKYNVIKKEIDVHYSKGNWNELEKSAYDLHLMLSAEDVAGYKRRTKFKRRIKVCSPLFDLAHKNLATMKDVRDFCEKAVKQGRKNS